MRTLIVGCGRTGAKRAAALGRSDALVGCVDTNGERARALARLYNAAAYDNVAEALHAEPECVVVGTTPDSLASVSCLALAHGAHVLVEKPAGIGSDDIDLLLRAAREAGRYVQVGFNHRFHPAIARACREAASGEHGRVLYLRARYGHGGRPGYGTEWRFDPNISGGGELVDQGVHLLDLSYWLLGPLPSRHSFLTNSYWGGAVEDNAIVLLAEERAGGPFAVLIASWTEWKNIFSLEIACERAKLEVNGLVGSYGAQRLVRYRMRGDSQRPLIEEYAFSDRDLTWRAEWRAFRRACRRNATPDLSSALYAWEVIEGAGGSGVE